MSNALAAARSLVARQRALQSVSREERQRVLAAVEAQLVAVRERLAGVVRGDEFVSLVEQRGRLERAAQSLRA